MDSLEDLKTEQALLIRTIKQRQDRIGDEFAINVELTPLEDRLATVNRKIAAMEEPMDHGGWEDH